MTRLLDVTDLHVEFPGPVKAVNGLSYTLDAGETVAILGESGSGKSVSALAVMGLLDPPARITQGSIHYRDQARPPRPGREVAMVFQDALTALNPVMPVGRQITESLKLSRKEARGRAIELLELVRIPDAAKRAGDYPHEFSGGMRQRVMIAVALAQRPDVLIADEPTTALDVTVQARIMRLLRDLQEELEMGLVLITHDLGVVAEAADRIVVMYAGREIEEAAAKHIYAAPAHPYTAGLLASVPRLEARRGTPLDPIPGSPPNPAQLPAGCAFHPRCPRRADGCDTDVPLLRDLGTHRAACHYA
jgi:oligopeptide/dipeptide ABC transporter ATP-binding protein